MLMNRDAQNQMIVMRAAARNDQKEEAGNVERGREESSHKDRVVLYTFDVASPHRCLNVLEEMISVLTHLQGRL